MGERVRSERCKHCGRLETAHGHAFEAAIVPKGCVCDPTSWRGNEPSNAICDRYLAEHYVGDQGNCVRCEHSYGCHEESRS